MPDDNLAVPLHHNNPPPDLLTGDMLRERLRDEHYALLKRRDELLAAFERMPAVTDDAKAGTIGDYIKLLAALAKLADAARVSKKEPYLDGGRTVDAFFKAIVDPVESTKQKAQRHLTGYLREKEAAERRAAEAEAERQRQEAERLRREAWEREQKAKDDAGIIAAIEAEQKAETAAADAAQLQKAAEAKPADFSRTRGEYGSVASLRAVWTFDNIDRATLDLEALRAHFPHDAFEKAIRSFIRAGGRELRGVKIYETATATVR